MPAPSVIRHSLRGSPRRRRGGFALLITVTLLAFLVLLLVSLAGLTRVETQVAGNSQRLAQARQNALFALNIAIGQLQKTTGPDQRVTATADVQPIVTVNSKLDPASGVDMTGATSTVISSIDSYWRASRNRHWTGAWKNGNTVNFVAVKDTPSDYNPVASLQSWLVSGNELGASFTPQTPLTSLANAKAPDDNLTDAAGNVYRLLVGSNTAGATASSTDFDRLVTAPQQDIKVTNVPGTNGAATTIGHYAWWVGDEGVKARADLVDPYAGNNTSAAKLARLQSAQRPAIEAMSVNGSATPTANADNDGLAPYYPVNDPRLDTVIDGKQLEYLNTSSVCQDQLRKRYHDLSIWSRGVLSDAYNGGLKTDLSYLLAKPTVATFQAALKTAYNNPSFDPTARAYNSPFSGVTTPYVSAFPTIGTDRYFSVTYEGDGTAADAGIFAYGATWEQLWSYYNMGNKTSDTPAGVFDASGTTANGRSAGATQEGLAPVLVQGKVFYRIRFGPGGVILVDVIPMAVLANPYNVTLAGDFILKFEGYDPKLYVGSPADPANPAAAEFSSAGAADPGNCYLGAIQLVLHATGIPPGEAQIFTVDSAAPAAVTTIASTTDSHQVNMINDYDPDACLTYNTGKTIPAGKTHAALYVSGGLLDAELFIGNSTNYTNRLNNTLSFRASNSGMSGTGFLVNPVSSGVQQGGGLWFTYDDGVSPSPQQSPFYQLNYRAMIIASSGYGTPNNHPLQWVHCAVRYGVTGSNDNTPNPFLSANFMLPPGSSTSAATTHWGLANNGEGNFFTTTPAAMGGASSTVGLNNLMFDLPKPGQPVTSLGQLQHFNTAGHADGLTTYSLSKNAFAFRIPHQWQVNYPIGNSYPHPRVNRDQVFNMSGDFSYHYDGSYLWNTILWDRFFFSSYPQSGSFDFATGKLINARYAPFRDNATVPLNDPTKFRGLFLAAQNLLAEGAFNINSTSVDAWKAVFSSLKNVPVGSETTAANLTAPFARTLGMTGGSTDAKAGNTDNAWNGFRNLTTTEINSLANEMVLQIRKRGPFLSMSQFVNRRLVTTANDTSFNLGLGGALQAAIDTVLNKKADIQGGSPFTDQTAVKGNNNNHTHLAELAYRMPTRISGFPGYLLQGDVLSSIGPGLTARSDTFTIRTYGDVVNPANPSSVEGRAWCEAVVQRLPDYVVPLSAGGNDPSDTPAAGSTNATFGRRYQIVSFRWLGPGDI